jgi:hypothetical protein
MSTHTNMRIYHRYLGFFLAGIMAVYAVSGVLLIFRESDFLKKEKQTIKTLPPDFKLENLGKIVKKRDLKIDKTENGIVYFKNGTYNTLSREVNFKSKEYPLILDKMTQLHKSSTKQPLYILNVFFGFSLLFFVISSFWMFLPKTEIFKKSIYFTLAGMVLVLILLFV